MNISSLPRYLSLTPFDTGSEQGRSDERYRLATLSILGSVLSRAASVVLMLLSVSLTIPYLGLERFGLWMTIASFAGILTFLDLGVGNALTNHVAKRSAKDNSNLLCQTISGGLGFLAIIGFIVGVVLFLISTYVPWWSLIKISDTRLLIEARHAGMCFSLFFGLSIFTSGVQRVFSGLQISYQAHLVSVFTTIVGCVGLWFAASSNQGICPLICILMGSQSAAGIILLIVLKARNQFSLKGIFSLVNVEASHLFKTGGLFFVLQIGTMVGGGADSLIISSTIGVTYVALFVVVQRLFQFATQPLSILNASLWGAYADANAHLDKKFIKKTLIKSMQTTLLVSCFGVVILTMLHKVLIDFWTDGAIVPPLTFVVFYAVWTIFEALGNAFSIYLNGVGVVSAQVKAVILFISLVFPIKIILIKSLGIVGIPIATLIAYIIAISTVYGIYSRKEILRGVS